MTVLFLGFSSGLPIALTAGTLQAWFTTAGVDLVTIGFLALVGQPYVYKFLWAPVMDRFVPPLLGRRRGWILITQLGLVFTIALLVSFDPTKHTLTIAIIAFIMAIFSASQDIAIDAYRTDVLKPEERGLGAAMSVGGYRIAMIVSGAVALILADLIGWQLTYYIIAACMLIGIIACWFGPEPENKPTPPASLKQAFTEPFSEFMSRKNAVALLLLIILYKLGDAFAFSLTTPFLIRELEFSLMTVGTVTKGMGLLATIVGLFFGGTLMTRIGLYRSLMVFGLLQAFANLSMMLLAHVGHHYPLMVFCIFIENLCAGMGTAAFVALIMSLCDARYTASQFALFSALAGVGRIFVAPFAGVMVGMVGWVQFYFWTFVLGLPGLVLLWWIQESVRIQASEVN